MITKELILVPAWNTCNFASGSPSSSYYNMFDGNPQTAVASSKPTNIPFSFANDVKPNWMFISLSGTLRFDSEIRMQYGAGLSDDNFLSLYAESNNRFQNIGSYILTTGIVSKSGVLAELDNIPDGYDQFNLQFINGAGTVTIETFILGYGALMPPRNLGSSIASSHYEGNALQRTFTGAYSPHFSLSDASISQNVETITYDELTNDEKDAFEEMIVNSGSSYPQIVICKLTDEADPTTGTLYMTFEYAVIQSSSINFSRRKNNTWNLTFNAQLQQKSGVGI